LEMFEKVYEIYHTIEKDLTPVIEIGMNKNSAKMTLQWYDYILKGEFKKRTASKIQIKFILKELFLDNNVTGLENVLKYLRQYKEHYNPNFLNQYIEDYEEKLQELKYQDYLYPDEIKNTKNLFEGAKKQVTVNIYERDSKARQQCIEKYGYTCYVCNFDFGKTYGKIGENFIHIHHLKPLSEIKEEYEVNPINDLRPVCPNCHAMLHKRNPAYSIKEVQNFIKKKTYKKLVQGFTLNF